MLKYIAQIAPEEKSKNHIDYEISLNDQKVKEKSIEYSSGVIISDQHLYGDHILIPNIKVRKVNKSPKLYDVD